MKIDKKKAALTLAAVGLISVSANTLSACNSVDHEEEKQEELEDKTELLKPELNENAPSETTVDAKDIIIVDTFNEKLNAIGMNERYLVLLKVNETIEPSLHKENATTKYIEFKDIMNFNFSGIFGMENNTKGEAEYFTFAYGDKTGEDLSKMAAYLGNDTINDWVLTLKDVIDPSYLKDTYSINELKEIYALLNEGIELSENNYNVTPLSSTSYTLRITK